MAAGDDQHTERKQAENPDSPETSEPVPSPAALIRQDSDVARQMHLSKQTLYTLMAVFGHISVDNLRSKYDEYTLFGNGCSTLSRVSFQALLSTWTEEATGAPASARRLVSNPHFIDRLFFLFDTNHDGAIDFGEFHCTLALLCTGSASAKLRFAFDALDGDGDGLLDAAEVGQFVRGFTNHGHNYEIGDALQLTAQFGDDVREDTPAHQKLGYLDEAAIAQGVAALFAAADSDGDGKLSFAEFSTHLLNTPSNGSSGSGSGSGGGDEGDEAASGGGALTGPLADLQAFTAIFAAHGNPYADDAAATVARPTTTTTTTTTGGDAAAAATTGGSSGTEAKTEAESEAGDTDADAEAKVEAAAGAGAAEAAAAPKKKKKRKNWLPLESNPELITRYAQHLGMPATYCFHDVLSTDDWALDMIPQPVRGIVLLFPCTESGAQANAEQRARIEAQGQVVSDSVYHMKQKIGNACGTIGLLHALGNAADTVPPNEGSWLQRFLANTRGAGLTPGDIADAIAEALEEDEEIERAHVAVSHQGQSRVHNPDEQFALHFICLTVVEGHLYELDGCKPWPVNHGECDPDNLLASAAGVIRGMMARDPGNYRFSILALAPDAPPAAPPAGDVWGAAPANATCPICGTEGTEVAIAQHIDACLASLG